MKRHQKKILDEKTSFEQNFSKTFRQFAKRKQQKKHENL